MQYRSWEDAVIAGCKAAEAGEYDTARADFKSALDLMPKDHPMRPHIEDVARWDGPIGQRQAAALGYDI
jgi:hypothetical protein